MIGRYSKPLLTENVFFKPYLSFQNAIVSKLLGNFGMSKKTPLQNTLQKLYTKFEGPTMIGRYSKPLLTENVFFKPYLSFQNAIVSKLLGNFGMSKKTPLQNTLQKLYTKFEGPTMIRSYSKPLLTEALEEERKKKETIFKLKSAKLTSP